MWWCSFVLEIVRKGTSTSISFDVLPFGLMEKPKARKLCFRTAIVMGVVCSPWSFFLGCIQWLALCLPVLQIPWGRGGLSLSSLWSIGKPELLENSTAKLEADPLGCISNKFCAWGAMHYGQQHTTPLSQHSAEALWMSRFSCAQCLRCAIVEDSGLVFTIRGLFNACRNLGMLPALECGCHSQDLSHDLVLCITTHSHLAITVGRWSFWYITVGTCLSVLNATYEATV